MCTHPQLSTGADPGTSPVSVIAGWLSVMTSARSRIRITDPVGMIAAVPAALGFHPSESVLLLCLRRGRLGPVMRADIPDVHTPVHTLGELVDHLGDQGLQHGDTVILLVFSSRDDAVAIARLGLHRLRRRLQVADVMIVDGSRVTFLPDDHGVTRPSVPIPIDDDISRQLSAASALSGRTVLPDREALRASVAPPMGHVARIGLHQLEVAQAEITHARARGEIPDPATELFVARAEHDHDHRLSGATAARLAALTRDVLFRDAVIAHILGPRAGEWVPLLVAALTRVPGAGSEDLCAVLIATAYRAGDGALAQICADRSLETAPWHRLTVLLINIMGAGLPPDSLDGLKAPPPSGTVPRQRGRR